MNPARLDEPTAAAIAAPENSVFVSVASIWEISIKTALQRLVFPLDDVDEIMRDMGFDLLPIMPAHAVAAGRLPRHHNDPFDRMLIAQAATERVTLASHDQAFRSYDVPLMGGGAG